MFIHYCQWNGNEEELEKLLRIIQFADPRGMKGEFCDFYSVDVKISESAVDEHIRLKYGCFAHTFQKHTGVFQCPAFDYIRDEREAAYMLDECFYACRIGEYFKKPAVANT